MAIMSEDDCRALMKKALSYSKADECEINLNGSEGGNIRYARNAVSTSGYISQTTMAISSAFGKKLGIVTLNEYDDASIEKAVHLSEELAHLAPENPEYVPFMEPQNYEAANPKLFDQKTSEMTPEQRTDMVEQSLKVAKDNNSSSFSVTGSTNVDALCITKRVLGGDTSIADVILDIAAAEFSAYESAFGCSRVLDVWLITTESDGAWTSSTAESVFFASSFSDCRQRFTLCPKCPHLVQSVGNQAYSTSTIEMKPVSSLAAIL